MSTTTDEKYEYSYQDSETEHHHAYIIPALMEMISESAPLLESKPKPRILDIGCGNGSLTNLIAQSGYEVVGVEESKSGVELAKQVFPNCQFIQGSIYNLPYAEIGDNFDLVIAAEVIEHLFLPRELVRNAKKCLKPNGRLIVTTPYHGYLKNLILAVSGKMDQHFTALWDGGHIKFFSVSTITQLLELEGYGDIKFKFAGRFPYTWKSILCSSTLS
ncbi:MULTISPECIES: class I SAM-dependent methyltransferase [unclassified Nodularia (in: cyanobacteria)]|uniref:class I SAM-dependent methyltransferase n=1 Tax=unclassified Nodularia (in: cyanobacteria) TaxID=2656917 RepID=UPI00187E0E6D|nr:MULTISPECIES: class I SAM-dependent methyltransferase [unclassified Nodularia (in: cyanobacteria)]MBE9199422.1 methyltransferase domain-containing protein [Nodularia sp. LEGE 06071]MCC2692920.1 methyltransferase domain-containing protein [Nodularia sp. LEGE 04288]